MLAIVGLRSKGLLEFELRAAVRCCARSSSTQDAGWANSNGAKKAALVRRADKGGQVISSGPTKVSGRFASDNVA